MRRTLTRTGPWALLGAAAVAVVATGVPSRDAWATTAKTWRRVAAAVPVPAKDSLARWDVRAHSPSANGLPWSIVEQWTKKRVTEGQKVASILVGTNSAVYLAWKLAPRRENLAAIMHTFFMSSAVHTRNGILPSLLLSGYSHMDLWHIALNMMALWSFVPVMVDGHRRHKAMSMTEFFLWYNLAVVGSSLTSNAFFGAIGRNIPSLGASGALFAVFTYIALEYPQSGVSVLFFLDMTAEQALLGLTGVNVLLCLAAMSRRKVSIDGAGHLGGTAVGWLWHEYRKRSRST